jgi:UDP-N-acetyl-D-mannosaminuronic acid transferase (WecB/TagA/CpsF family)
MILGVCFFNGAAEDAAAKMISGGGLLVAPASPALLKLKYDERYRRALQQADIALADSKLLVVLWGFLTGRKVNKNSGLSYLKALIESGEIDGDNRALFVVSSDEAKQKAIAWLESRQMPAADSMFYVADAGDEEDHNLLLQIEESRPRHIIIALGTGTQEWLGLYLRDYLLYRPSIHCIGAALGFLTGAERPMPLWAERHQLGWLARFAAEPGMVLPRIGSALALTAAVLKHRAELPPLTKRWSDR